MDTQKAPEIGKANAWLVIAIKDGCLVFSATLPLRWTLLMVGAVSTAVGSPIIVEVANNLLRAR